MKCGVIYIKHEILMELSIDALNAFKKENYNYQATHSYLLKYTMDSLKAINQASDTIETSEKIAIIITGPNASGKSTVASRLLPLLVESGVKMPFLNPDMIAKIKFDNITPEEDKYMKYAMPYTNDIRLQLVNLGQSFMLETVFSNPKKLELILELKKSDYYIHTIFICTDNPDINIKRAAVREEAGGHAVPIDKIITRYYKSLSNISQIFQISDSGVVIENSKEPYLIFQKSNDVHCNWLLNKNDYPEWIKSITW